MRNMRYVAPSIVRTTALSLKRMVLARASGRERLWKMTPMREALISICSRLWLVKMRGPCQQPCM